MKSLLLDSEQSRPVTCDDNTVVIAGPGSGKTRTLIAKALHLARKKERHIALTFTRAAAQQLRLRSPTTNALTIHSLCYQCLGFFPRSKNYSDLLWDFLDLNRKPWFQWVLVDEAMDLTELEYAVIRVLTREGGKIFAVGDPCQHIYEWAEEPLRPSSQTFKSMEAIKQEYNCRSFSLSNNYRSNETIVQEIEALHMRNLIPKGPNKTQGTAVLFRTNRQMELVAHALETLKILSSVKRRGNGYPGDIKEYKRAGTPVLATIHVTKGLEFKKVITWNWGEKSQERNLEYVAVARASQEHHAVNSITECLEALGAKI